MKMKKYLLIALAIFTLVGCEKDENAVLKTAVDPKVAKATFYPGYSGANVSLVCTLQLEIPSPEIIKSVMMIKDGSTVEGDKVLNPKTGSYTLYDHQLSSFPSGKYYRFVFTKTDGTIILSEKYQVQ